MNFDEGTLTKAGLAAIRKQMDSSIEGMIPLRKVDLTMLLNMASKVVEVPKDLADVVKQILKMPTAPGWELFPGSEEHIAQLIQAWHEAQLPVVTQDAREQALNYFICLDDDNSMSGIEKIAQRIAARDAKIREAWMPKPYWRDHVLCIGLQMLYEVRNVGGDLWVARDVDGGALFPPVSFDAARGQCETQAEAFIASLTAPVTEDGGEK